MNSFYVYAYLDPRKPGNFSYSGFEFDYEPFYIGKGRGSRINRHLNINKEFNNIKKNKINKIIQFGKRPILIKIKENLSNQESLQLEIKLINIIGRITRKTGPLTNFTMGGETYLGYKHKQKHIDKLTKPVILYDLKGNIIEEYKSIKEAGLKNNILPQTISKICNRDIKVYKDKYVFLYKSDEFAEIIKKKKEYSVIRIDHENKKTEYESATKAAIENNCNLSKICQVCKGKNFQTGGFIWRYKNHPKSSEFNLEIQKNFGKYLELFDRNITDNDKKFNNILHVINSKKNMKINNLINLLSKNKIYRFV